MDYAMETLRYDVCPYVADPVNAVREALQQKIKAQPLAVETIVNAFSAWHFRRASARGDQLSFSRKHATLSPLVLALTGSTGTGKTETAWVLARALLSKTCRITGGTTDIPRGLITLNGGDYINEARVEEYHRAIRGKLARRLKYCGGNVVVLFDEIQKAAPGTLDALTEAMSEHPRVTVEGSGWLWAGEGLGDSLDSSRVIFLLVSDVGSDGVNAAVMRHRSRSEVAAGPLQAAVKRSLDEQWDR
ncbi:unnamed protein product [Discosporangium mesarthrocarpum]